MDLETFSLWSLLNFLYRGVDDWEDRSIRSTRRLARDADLLFAHSREFGLLVLREAGDGISILSYASCDDAIVVKEHVD